MVGNPFISTSTKSDNLLSLTLLKVTLLLITSQLWRFSFFNVSLSPNL